MLMRIASLTIGVISLVAMGLCFASALHWPVQPTTGVGIRFERAGVYRVTSIDAPRTVPFRLGERVRFSDMSPRYRSQYARPQLGQRFTMVSLDRPGIAATLTVHASGPIPPFFRLLFACIFGPFAAMGLLIAARKPKDRTALELAGFFACFAIAGTMSPRLAALPAGPQVIVAIFIQCVYGLGGMLVVLFACDFPERTHDGARAVLRRIAFPAGAMAIGISVVQLTKALVGFVPPEDLRNEFLVLSACWLYFIAASIGALTISLLHSRGLQRQQMLWVVLTFAIGFSGVVVLFVAIPLNAPLEIVGNLTATIIVVPFGLAYVILRHRVIDIGFALNRATVFGGVSLVVVGAFVFLEWLGARVFVEANHVTASYVELLVALALGFSLRFVHARVDHVVDDVFFRERHANEAALRRFARELPFLTDRTIALQRTAEVLRSRTQCAWITVYLVEGDAFGAAISSLPSAPALAENDALVPALKAWREPIEIGERESALGEGVAFPLIVRGELQGALCIGPKAGAEIYAPDERDAVRTIGDALASLLDSLEVAELRRRLRLQPA